MDGGPTGTEGGSVDAGRWTQWSYLSWFVRGNHLAGLTKLEAKVMMVLISHCGADRETCHPSLDTIVEKAGTSSRRLYAVLDSLERKNLISRRRSKGGKEVRTVYRMEFGGETMPLFPIELDESDSTKQVTPSHGLEPGAGPATGDTASRV
jgi:DNA-binding MarR family transcriptional regulator